MTIEALKQKIIYLFRETLLKLYPKKKALLQLEIELEVPPNQKMGNVSIPCFSVAKLLNKSPEKIAGEFVKSFKPNKIIVDVKNVGPYLNFFINKKVYFETTIRDILKKGDDFGKSDIGKNKKILIEFSSPNANKPQHLGHLRNNFLGMALANIFSFLGYDVIRANLINDRGIHICKAMVAYKKWGEGKVPKDKKGDHFVGDFYILFEKRVKENPELLAEAQEMLKKWEEGDSETVVLWQKLTKWTIDGLKKTYKDFGIKFDKWYFESETYKIGKTIVLRALRRGLCSRRKDGAIEIDLSKYGFDKKVLIRADGTSVYVTQDIGLAKLKYDEFKPNCSIYIVASEQDYYFKILFKILAIFGFSWVKNCYHLSYGMVFLPEGKIKSREGKIVEADDMLNEMINLAKTEIFARKKDITPLEASYRAKVIALAAIKFFFLKFTPKQNINFKPKESISFEGATGPYIQYTYARIKSILRKVKNFDSKKNSFSNLGNVVELDLCTFLFNFSEILKKSLETYNPAYLSNYLLNLSQKFNEFYQKHSVLNAESENLKNERLALIKSVAQVIKNGLKLLGIDVLEEM
ncbi:arginine--tRNA ligase [bacterium]|nr:arginine--tRNA ligase [bacterium]